MTTSAPSFPPADDLLSWIESIDWLATIDKLVTLTLYIVAVCHILVRRSLPYVATALRTTAAWLDTVGGEPVPTLANTIQKRLAAGESQRAIARSLGVSRHVVARHAN